MATFPTLNAQTSELLQSGRAKDAQSTQAANDLLASWPQEAQDLYWAARNSKTVLESAADDGAMMHTAEQLKRIVAKAYGRPELAALPLRAFNEGNQDFNTGREALQRMTDLAKRSARPDINDPKIQAAALIGDESKAIYEFLQNLRANDGERIEAAKAARLAELQNTTWSIDGEEKERLFAGDLETTAKIEQGRLDREHFIEAAKQFGLYPEDVEGDETYDRIQTEIRTLQRDLAPAINNPIPVPDLPERKPTMSLREAWGEPPMDVGERWEGGQAQENIGTWEIQSANAVRDRRIEDLEAHATLIKDNLAYDNLVMRLSQNAALSSYLEVYDTLNPAERELIKRAFVAGQEGINLGHMVAEGGFSEDNAKRTFGATATLDELNAWEADNGRWTRVGNQYLFARIDPAHEETVRTIISLARGRIEEPQYLADLFNRVGQSFDRTFGNIPRFIAASAKQLGHSFFANEDSYANYAEQTRYEARREALWEAATSALTYDPGYGWFGDAVIGMAEQTPIWLTLAAGGAASAISGGAVPGTQIAMGALAMGYAEDTRQQLILDGADPLSALVGGVASGVVQSWIERAQAEALIGKNAVGKFMLSGAHDAKVAIANAFYKRSLREFGTWQFAQTAFRLGGGIAANGFLEAVEEGLQAGADRLISDLALGDPNFERALKTGIKEFKDTFATMMVTAGFGGTVRVTRDFAQAASVGKRLRILTGQGKVGERAMKAIEEVGKTMDVAALREAWRNASNDRARIKLLMDTGHLPKSQATALHAYLIAEEKIADRHDALAMQMMLDMSNEGAKTFANNPEAIKRVMQAIGLRNVKVEATVIGTVTKDNAKNEREGWAVSATLPGGGTVTFTVGVMTEQEKTLDGGAATASSAWEALQDAKELKGMTQSQFAERWRTDEAWRAKLIEDYSLARRGETIKLSESPYLVATFTTPDGKTRKRKVSAAGAILLATGGHGRQVVAENKTLAHETLHALVQLLRDTGVLTTDAPIVQDLRRIYGDPAKGVDELFNEERFADDLAATAGRGIEAIERAAGEATRRKVGPVARALHGIADLFMGGGDFVLDNGTITVRKEADANARANRFVDAINLHVLLGASKQAADVFRRSEKQRSLARLQRLREGLHARIKEAREKAETEAEQALRDAEMESLVDSDLSEMAEEAHAIAETELNAVRTEIEEAAANIREHFKGFDPKAEGESAKRTRAEGKKFVDRWRALKNRELELMRTLADLNVDPSARREYIIARENEAHRLQGRAARATLDAEKRRINETPVADGDALLANTRAIGHVTVESRESYIKRKMAENGWDRKTAIAQATHLYPEDMADLRAPWANRNLYTGKDGHSPDTAAQALYDDGRIADPTVDAFWDAVRGDIEVVSKAKKREIAAAEAEAASALAWGKERHLQTLAAIEMQDEATGLGMGQERSSIGPGGYIDREMSNRAFNAAWRGLETDAMIAERLGIPYDNWRRLTPTEDEEYPTGYHDEAGEPIDFGWAFGAADEWHHVGRNYEEVNFTDPDKYPQVATPADIEGATDAALFWLYTKMRHLEREVSTNKIAKALVPGIGLEPGGPGWKLWNDYDEQYKPTVSSGLDRARERADEASTLSEAEDAFVRAIDRIYRQPEAETSGDVDELRALAERFENASKAYKAEYEKEAKAFLSTLGVKGNVWVTPARPKTNSANGITIRSSIGGLFTGARVPYARPDLRYVGTGEHSQVYGWGLYASAVRDIAQNTYGMGFVEDGLHRITRSYSGNPHGGEREYATFFAVLRDLMVSEKKYKTDASTIPLIEEARQAIIAAKKDEIAHGNVSRERLWFLQDQIEAMEELDPEKVILELDPNTPAVHEQVWWTHRPEGDESHLLNWHEPISNELREAILVQAKREGLDLDLQKRTPYSEYSNNVYADVQRALLKKQGRTPWNAPNIEKEASEFLYRAGVDGIKYPADSYGKPQNKDGNRGWNYVAFSDEHLQVVRRWIWNDATEEFVLDRSFTPPQPTEAEARAAVGNDQAIAEAQANRSSIIGWKGALSLDVGGWRLKEDERKVRRLVKDAADGRRLLDGYYDAKREVERLVGTDFTRDERERASRLTQEGPIARDAIILAERWRRYTQSDEATEAPEFIAYRNWGWTLGKDGQWRLEIPYGKLREHVYPKLRNLAWKNEKTGTASIPLKELVDDPSLFAAYPELADTPVIAQANIDSGSSLGSALGSRIYIYPEKHKTRDQILKTLYHEIQHVIQFREDFENGEIYNGDWSRYANAIGEAEARVAGMNAVEGADGGYVPIFETPVDLTEGFIKDKDGTWRKQTYDDLTFQAQRDRAIEDLLRVMNRIERVRSMKGLLRVTKEVLDVEDITWEDKGADGFETTVYYEDGTFSANTYASEKEAVGKLKYTLARRYEGLHRGARSALKAHLPQVGAVRPIQANDYKKMLSSVPFAGNKTRIIERHRDFFRALGEAAMQNGGKVIDAFGGAGAYTTGLAQLGALPKGSILNEWSIARYTMHAMLARDHEAVAEAARDIVRRFAESEEMATFRAWIAEIHAGTRNKTKVTQPLVDWFNDELRGKHGEAYVEGEGNSEFGDAKMKVDARTAALYMVLQTMATGGYPINFIWNDKRGGLYIDVAGRRIGTGHLGMKICTGYQIDENALNPERYATRILTIGKYYKEAQLDVRRGDGWALARTAQRGDTLFVDPAYLGVQAYGGDKDSTLSRDANDVEETIAKLVDLARWAAANGVSLVYTNEFSDKSAVGGISQEEYAKIWEEAQRQLGEDATMAYVQRGTTDGADVLFATGAAKDIVERTIAEDNARTARAQEGQARSSVVGRLGAGRLAGTAHATRSLEEAERAFDAIIQRHVATLPNDVRWEALPEDIRAPIIRMTQPLPGAPEDEAKARAIWRSLTLTAALLAEGRSHSDLLRELGWTLGPDGLPRAELQPGTLTEKAKRAIEATKTSGRGRSITLGAFLDDPALFAAYPELRDLKVRIKTPGKLPKGVLGEASFEKGEIALLAASEQEILDSVYHETQHIIQNLEGFAPGDEASTGMDAYSRSMGEVEARAAGARATGEPGPYESAVTIPRTEMLTGGEAFIAHMTEALSPGDVYEADWVKAVRDLLGFPERFVDRRVEYNGGTDWTYETFDDGIRTYYAEYRDDGSGPRGVHGREEYVDEENKRKVVKYYDHGREVDHPVVNERIVPGQGREMRSSISGILTERTQRSIDTLMLRAVEAQEEKNPEKAPFVTRDGNIAIPRYDLFFIPDHPRVAYNLYYLLIDRVYPSDIEAGARILGLDVPLAYEALATQLQHVRDRMLEGVVFGDRPHGATKGGKWYVSDKRFNADMSTAEFAARIADIERWRNRLLGMAEAYDSGVHQVDTVNAKLPGIHLKQADRDAHWQEVVASTAFGKQRLATERQQRLTETEREALGNDEYKLPLEAVSTLATLEPVVRDQYDIDIETQKRPYGEGWARLTLPDGTRQSFKSNSRNGEQEVVEQIKAFLRERATVEGNTLDRIYNAKTLEELTKNAKTSLNIVDAEFYQKTEGNKLFSVYVEYGNGDTFISAYANEADALRNLKRVFANRLARIEQYGTPSAGPRSSIGGRETLRLPRETEAEALDPRAEIGGIERGARASSLYFGRQPSYRDLNSKVLTEAALFATGKKQTGKSVQEAYQSFGVNVTPEAAAVIADRINDDLEEQRNARRNRLKPGEQPRDRAFGLVDALAKAYDANWADAQKEAFEKGVAGTFSAARQMAEEAQTLAEAQRQEAEAITGTAPAILETEMGFDIESTLLAAPELTKTKAQLDESVKKAEERRKEELEQMPEAEEIADSDVEQPIEAMGFTESKLDELQKKRRELRERLRKLEKEREEQRKETKKKYKGKEGAGEENGAEDDKNYLEYCEKMRKTLNGIAFDLDDAPSVREFVNLIILHVAERRAGKEIKMLADLRMALRDPLVVRDAARTLAQIAEDLANRLVPSAARELIVKKAMNLAAAETIGQVRYLATGALLSIRNVRIRQGRTELRDAMVKMIDSVVPRGRFAVGKEDSDRSIGGDVARMLDNIRKALLFGEATLEEMRWKAIDLICGLSGRVRKGEAIEDFRDYQTAMRIIASIDRFGHWRRMSLGELDDLRVELERMINGGIEAHELKMRQMEAKIDGFLQPLLNALNQNPPDFKPDQNAPLRERIANALDHGLGLQSLLFEALLARSTGETRAKAQRAVRDLLNAFSEASAKYEATLLTWRERIQQIAERHYGSTRAFMRRMHETVPEHLRDLITHRRTDAREKAGKAAHQRTRITYGQALQIYATLAQRDYTENARIHHRDGASFAAVRACLTDADIAFVAECSAFMRAIFPELRDAYAEVTGVTVGTTPDYWPVKIDYRRDGLSAEVRAWTPIVAAMEPRRKNGLDLKEEISAEQMLFGRLDEWARMLAYGRLGIIAAAVFGNGSLKEAIANSLGQKMEARIQENIKTALMGPPTKADNAIILSTRWASAFAMSGNLGVAFKQFAGIPAFALKLGAKDTIEAWWNGVTRLADADWDADWAILTASNAYKSRYGGAGLNAEMRAALQGATPGAVAGATAKAYDIGFRLQSVADRAVAKPFAIGALRKYREAYLREGLTAEEAQRRAVIDAWALVEDTQQSARPENQLDLVNRSKIVRMLAQFRSAPLQQLQWEMRAWAAFLRGEEGAKEKLARVIFINHILTPLFWTAFDVLWQGALGLFGPGDEDDEEKMEGRRERRLAQWVRELALGAILGQLTAVPVLGGAVEATYSTIAQNIRRKAEGKEPRAMTTTELATAATDVPAIRSAADIAATVYNVGLAATEVEMRDVASEADDLLKTAVPIYRDASKAAEQWGIGDLDNLWEEEE